MVTSDELDRLMQAGIKDPGREIEFFRALLDATVFAHGPTEEADPVKLHFLMLKSPDDKEWVIPVFTDLAKAQRASSPTVRILAMSGRKLLELTRGGAVMLNPNDRKCTLFPEEIAQLLDHGTLPPIERFRIDSDGDAHVYRLEGVPRAIQKVVRKALSGISSAEVAYVAGAKWKSGQPDGVIVAVGGGAPNGEHVARAISSALQLSPEPIYTAVNVTYFDPKASEPPWIKNLRIPAIYRRALANTRKRRHRYH